MILIDELQKKYGIGLTGGIACGKSTVSKILANLGFPVIDADALARKAVNPGTKGLARIVELFGGAILQDDGQLNRKMMADIVFNDPVRRKTLESVVHPAIYELLEQDLRDKGLFQHPRYWFYEATLLFETGSARKYREVWAVYCPQNIQLARLKKRDGRDQKLADKIIQSQMPAKVKASKANVVIDTSTPLEELEAKIRLALETLPAEI